MLCVDTFFFITCTLIQHLVLNRMNKQDSTPLGISRLTDRQTQIIHSSQPLQTVQLCWVLTDTSQQQLYPKQNRENNHESDACWFVTIFCLCRAAIAAHSGCSSILLPQLNSCPLIYTPNLATIKIPWLLVNSLSRSCSTSHSWFVSSDNSCHVMQMPRQPIQICVRRTLALSDVSTESRCVSQEAEAHWGPINPGNTWWAASRNRKQSDGCNHRNHWINLIHEGFFLTKQWQVIIWMS